MLVKRDVQLAITLLANSALKYLVFFLWRNSKPPGAVRVGTLKKILMHPLKSGGAISLPEVECTYEGPQLGQLKDRSWIVTFGDENRFVTGRQEPKLTTVQCSLQADSLVLSAEGMKSLELPIELGAFEGNQVKTFRVHGIPVKGIDCGKKAADWIDNLLGKKGHHLLHHEDPLQRRSTKEGARAYKRDFYLGARPVDMLAYQDSAPYSLGTDISIGNLADRLGWQITSKQFRHTFEIAAIVPAFDEDSWADIVIGDVRFGNFAPIERCIQTLVNPETGKKNEENEPLKTLKQYRSVYPEMFGKNPAFGRLLLLEKAGRLKVGDPVFACYSTNRNSH